MSKQIFLIGDSIRMGYCEEVKKQLEAKQTELDELNDKYLRMAAEYDNFRRRTQKEKEQIYSDSYADIIEQLLPIIDNFEMASNFSDGDKLVGDIMETEIIYATTHDDKEYVADTISKYGLLALPIVDKENRLVGIVTVDDALDVITEEVTEEVAEETVEEVVDEVTAEEVLAEDEAEVVEAEAVEEETAEEDKVSEADTEEEIEEKVEDTEVAVEKPKRSAGRKVLIALGVALATAAVLLGAYVGLSRLNPEIFDSILYSAEELEILNYMK